MIRVNNYIRCVRGGSVKIRTSAPSENKSKYPYNIKIYRGVSQEGQRGSKGKSRRPSGGRGFVERLDRNGDGKISRSEFDGPKDRFDYHDKNNDGLLKPRLPKARLQEMAGRQDLKSKGIENESPISRNKPKEKSVAPW